MKTTERPGKRGATGARGSAGARGLTGRIGRRGKTGKPGHKGPHGFKGPLHKDHALEMVMSHFDDVYQQLEIQTKRLARVQQRVDILVAKAAKPADRDDIR
jgi:hypothetical protein